MGFFFRKSINLGKGFRLNLSKTGIGLSGGIKGLRVSRRGNRTTVSAGRNGLFFRKTFRD